MKPPFEQMFSSNPQTFRAVSDGGVAVFACRHGQEKEKSRLENYDSQILHGLSNAKCKLSKTAVFPLQHDLLNHNTLDVVGCS